MKRFKKIEKIEDLELNGHYFMKGTINSSMGYFVNVEAVDNGKVGCEYLTSQDQVNHGMYDFKTYSFYEAK